MLSSSTRRNILIFLSFLTSPKATIYGHHQYNIAQQCWASTNVKFILTTNKKWKMATGKNRNALSVSRFTLWHVISNFYFVISTFDDVSLVHCGGDGRYDANWLWNWFFFLILEWIWAGPMGTVYGLR